MNESMSSQLMQILREEYQRLDDANEECIDPAWLAEAARQKIDPERTSPALMTYAGVLQLRQMARSICRKNAEDEEQEITQGALFDGQLQKRYPAIRASKEQYILRERLSILERRQNSARLRAESVAKARHADALDAETDSLIAKGILKDAA